MLPGVNVSLVHQRKLRKPFDAACGKNWDLPISVGVARTKHLAKIASQVAKPDGLVVVDPATELEFLHDLPVDLMWGVGPVTKARLAEMGVLTIGQLAQIPGRRLERLLGHALGDKLGGAGVEPRSTGNQDEPSRAISRSSIGDWQDACRRASSPANAAPSCGQDRHAVAGANPAPAGR